MAALGREARLRRVLTVRFTFSGDETRHMMRYMLLRSRGPTILLAVGVVLLAIAAGTGRALWFGIAGAELFSWSVLVGVLPQFGVRGGGGEETLSFSDEGVTAANARGSQRFEWNHWRRWTRTGDLYLLRGAGAVFTFVPSRAFAAPDAESEFQALLARHLDARRPAGRRRREPRGGGAG